MDVAYARLRGAADSASLRDSLDMAMFTDSDFLPETSSVRVLQSELLPAADSALRRTSPGGYTPPVPSDLGWQIVLLDSVRADTYWVRRIRSRIRPDNATEIALGDTVRLFITAAQTQGLESASAQTGVMVAPMPLVLLDGRLTSQYAQVYAPGQLEEWARRARSGDVLDAPLRGPGGMYVCVLSDVKPAGVRPWDEQVRQAALFRARQEVQKQDWTARAAAAAAEIRAGKPLEQYAAEHPEVVFGVDTVDGAWDYSVRGARGIEFAGAAMALDPGQTTGPVETRGGDYIIRCDGRAENAVLAPEDYARQRQQQQAQELMRALWDGFDIRDYRPPRGY
jgi:hypothetical protein